MKHPSFRSLFFLGVASSLIFFPAVVKAGCEWGENPITIEAMNKPVGEILKDIEKQTDYVIAIDDKSVLDSSKSIVLKQAPLSQALGRILKDLNFSVICDDEQKTLHLVFLDKKTPAASMTATTEIDENLAGSMNDVDIAFTEHQSNTGAAFIPDPQEQDETIMTGATAAFEEYDPRKNTPSSEDYGESDETIMAGAADAFEEYNTSRKDLTRETEPQEHDETIMAGATTAFEGFTNSPAPSDQDNQEHDETIMAGATTAFVEYHRLNR
jgi:hypothetical protein